WRPQVTVLEEHEVMVAPIAEPEAFDGFMDTVADLRGTDPETRRYQETSIFYWAPEFLETEVLDESPPDDFPLEEEPFNGLPESPLHTIPKALPETEPEVMSIPEEPIPDVPGLAIAVFPDFLIAAEHPAAIRSWIDLRPENQAESLAAQERFQRTLNHPEYDAALGIFYGSMSEILKYSLVDFSLPKLPVDLPLPENVSPAEIAELAALQLDSSIEVLLYPQPEGIRLQGRGYYDETLLQLASAFIEPAPQQVLENVPDTSYLMLSGQNLAGAWQQVAALLETREETAGSLDQIRSFFSLITGLDLDEDLFGWMDQGFAVFLFPTRQTPLEAFVPDIHIGLGLALQTSDRKTAENTFAQLDEILGIGFAVVEPQILNDQPATSWGIDFDADGQPTSFLGHGWADEDVFVMTTSIGSLTEILNLSTRQRLPGSPIFRRATRGFPETNQGYFYSNISAILSFVFNGLPFPGPIMDAEADAEFPEFRKVIGTVQAFSGTLSFTEEHMQMDALIMLSPAR
ncbi:MAG: DUF3352 domain-containing protein, partial [Leptolyngbya sp. SIO1D8]|nr:DUF3352 domain-containing protein [Leptolyngbya sp. SIO1D8]